MMMLMSFDLALELFPADRLFSGAYLRFRPLEYLVGPDTVNRVFDEFAVLHHPLHIIGHPWLLFTARGHAHIAEQLLLRKGPDLFRIHFDAIVLYDLIHDQRPFQLVDERREFLLYFRLALGLVAAR